MNKSLIDELFEDDSDIVKSFYMKDTLCLDIFEKDGKMNKSIKDKLLEISDKFIDFLGVPFFIYDVVLTGSLSNYNWSEYSDVDLHILVDMDEMNDGKTNSDALQKIVKEFLDAKKNVWNQNHNIKIKGFEVELYVQDVNEPHVSTGVYSILNDKWVTKPTKNKNDIDDKSILEKGKEYSEIIDTLYEKGKKGEDVTNEVDDLKNKIKRFRQSGLEKGGEYSYENLTFKLLRRNGYIEKLLNIKKEITNNKLSVAQ